MPSMLQRGLFTLATIIFVLVIVCIIGKSFRFFYGLVFRGIYKYIIYRETPVFYIYIKEARMITFCLEYMNFDDYLLIKISTSPYIYI